MDMKLEMKHLAPYLPYELKLMQYREDIDMSFDCNMIGLRNETIKVTSSRFPFSEDIQYYEVKPILRPLSDLTKGDYAYIWENNITINEVHGFIKSNDFRLSMWNLPFYVWTELFKNHFDIFGLIEKGLAIDINTLEP